MRPSRQVRLSPFNSAAAVCLSLFLFLIFTGSCTEESTETSGKRSVSEKLRAYRESDAVAALKGRFGTVAVPEERGKPMPPDTAQAQAYAASGFHPLWVSIEGISTAATDLLYDLERMSADGLDPELYHLSALKEKKARLASSETLDAALDFDTSCTRAWLGAAKDLLFGRLRPRNADSLWFCANDSVWDAPARLARALLKEGKYPALEAYRSRLPVYALIREAYRNAASLARDSALFKDLDSSTNARYCGKPDSVAAMIAANLERLRWLPKDPDSQYVWVNVPMMRLAYYRDGYDAFGMRVVIGKPSRQTPSLSAKMANVVFNPGWGVPPTILKRDIAPGVARSGGAYLAKKGLHAYDRKGREVSRGSVNKNNFNRFTYKQPPGARNALGEVKFNFPNPWDIYLHDTPHREDFPKKKRALSSGCVRVEKPREFAEFLLSDIESRDSFNAYGIDSIIQTRQTRFENLKRKIPVYLVYLTAGPDSAGNRVVFYTDVYRRDAKLMRLLAAENASNAPTSAIAQKR